ncbi:lactonase family protein [Vibrio rumoiensis]|uniref:lactonase family protein n=1 Tax=Vibrio rumoiensis TaxID=76258 RepID=UPI000B5C6EDB|nr:beta-propeller fold lactonase family protein [Vibrio rumoiensis]
MTALPLIISGYTAGDEATGLYFAQLNTSDGHLVTTPSKIDLPHPSYFDVTIDSCEEHKLLTVISEVFEPQGPLIQQYSLHKNQIHLKSESSLTGSEPCYVENHIKHHLVTTAQYGSGHIDIFSTDDNHQIVQHIQTIDNQSLRLAENLASHAHQSLLLDKTKVLVSVDLGCDCVRFFPFNSTQNQFSINQHESLILPKDSGPRHMIFDRQERFGVILCEISEQLITLHKPNDKWVILSSQPAFPSTHNGQAAGAIKFSPDQRFIYVTGRRQNLIACFAFNQDSGDVVYQYSIDCGGDFPRDFAISPCGQWLVTANQNSHNLATYRRDITSGELEDTGYRHEVPSPVCVKFI